MARLTVVRYQTDPSSAPRDMHPRPLFDARRDRNLDMSDSEWKLFSSELPWVTDRKLVACLVAHGHPVRDAWEAVRFPKAKKAAAIFYDRVHAAARGDKAAQEWVDRARESWEKRRGVPLEEIG